ncbi:hypothetical protein OnM2_034074 [Erysiphe neolycopersici]|uniref:Reverse transcriptase n=1 Tax=Erysiphe neolycopersici TaxID=212602 RepID=A0A420HY74_9PEZI|nr:hypothetical protein OnM2_034074 [Erysiphe neolycopersici]
MIIIRNQAEANEVIRLFQIFCDGTGQKVNWDKSKLLRVGRIPEIHLPKVRVIPQNGHFDYLGIPVGIDLKEATSNYWKEIIEKARQTKSSWLKAYLSLKGRVLIANSLIMSTIRYGLRFLPIPDITKQEFLRIYWGMIWNDRTQGGIVSRQVAINIGSKGGLKCQDIDSIREAVAIDTIHRMEAKPQPLWAAIVTETLQDTMNYRTKSVKTSVVEAPWFQSMGSRRPNPIPDSLKHILPLWWKLLDKATSGEKGILCIPSPRNKREWEKIHFWYHPMINTTKGYGAKRFGTKTWQNIAYLGANTIGDLNAIIQDPNRLSDLNTSIRRNIIKAITNLFESFPDAWQKAGDCLSEVEVKYTGNVWLNTTKPERICKFSTTYKLALAHRQEQSRGKRRIWKTIDTIKTLTTGTVSERKLWRACSLTHCSAKTSDLIWRFLSDAVAVGSEIEWIPTEKQLCPNYNSTLTSNHLWAECEATKEVWRFFEAVIKKLGHRKVHIPTNLDEVVALMCIGFHDLSNYMGEMAIDIFYSSLDYMERLSQLVHR